MQFYYALDEGMHPAYDGQTNTKETDMTHCFFAAKALARAGRLGLAGIALALPLAWTGNASAQAFPNKPIRLMVPYAAGGAADTVARILAPKLTESLGQPIIIENRTGANGAIACAYVAAAAPDGYTLVINLGPSHQTLQLFTKGIKYDPVKDFTAISMVATAPQVLVVPASSPIKSVRELVDAAKSRPKGLSYGTSGVGTSQHLSGLLLGNVEKVNLTHVAYRGGAPALTDVVGGQIDAGILVLSNALPYIETGKLKALGVVENHRSKTSPGIPTVAEGGIAGFAVPDTWVGILGPAGMPAAVVQRLNADISKALKIPEVRAQLEKAGYEIVGDTAQQFSAQLSQSVAFYEKIVKDAGVVPE